MLDSNGSKYEQVATAGGWKSIETLIRYYSRGRGQESTVNLFEIASREVVRPRLVHSSADSSAISERA